MHIMTRASPMKKMVLLTTTSPMGRTQHLPSMPHALLGHPKGSHTSCTPAGLGPNTSTTSPFSTVQYWSFGAKTPVAWPLQTKPDPMLLQYSVQLPTSQRKRSPESSTPSLNGGALVAHV